MLEAVVIIIALGGLEIILWALDHRQQKKQIELLDSIWAELAIRNSAEEEREGAIKVRANSASFLALTIIGAVVAAVYHWGVS
ncbi:MAG: hypothetical protein WCC59_12380 [Terriglobales bacterium]